MTIGTGERTFISSLAGVCWLVGEGGGEVRAREHVILVYIFSSTLGGAVMLFGFHHLFLLLFLR